MEVIVNVLPVLVGLALLWFTYTNLSFAVTIWRAKKEDSTLSWCFSNTGKYFYIFLFIAYIALFITCLTLMILAIVKGNNNNIYLPLNVLTISTIICSFFFQQIILVGHRQMLIGKIKFDYRKIKRVTYPKSTKLKFVYGQRTLETSIRFTDDFKLKKALQKTR